MQSKSHRKHREKNNNFFPAFFPSLARLHIGLGNSVTDDQSSQMSAPSAALAHITWQEQSGAGVYSQQILLSR